MLRADVRASDSDGWVVVIDNERAGKPVHRMRDAVQLARRKLLSRGGGEVRVHSRNGRIVESQTVPRGRERLYT